MSEYMREKKKTAAENAEQEKQLMKALYNSLKPIRIMKALPAERWRYRHSS